MIKSGVAALQDFDPQYVSSGVKSPLKPAIAVTYGNSGKPRYRTISSFGSRDRDSRRYKLIVTLIALGAYPCARLCRTTLAASRHRQKHRRAETVVRPLQVLAGKQNERRIARPWHINP